MLHQQQEPGILWDINLTEKGIIMDRDNLKYTNVVLERIAAALEETLRLVKADQEATKKRWEYKPEDKEQESHDNNTSYKTYEKN